jgi:hypothetical protein
VSGLVITGVLAIVNVTALDVPPPGLGFTTVIEAVPGVAIRAAVTVAVSCVEDLEIMARAVPFQLTVEVETKFVPFTVKVNCAPPAAAQVGLSEVIVGTGLLMVKVCAFDVPPPGAGFTTVTEAVPAFATRAAVTVAVSCVEETNVVVKAVPFQRTDEVATKLVPFTVRVNCGDPAKHELGLIEVIVGTGLLIVNITVFDTGPVEFLTVTFAVPPTATLAAGTIAVTCAAEIKVVLSAAPFHCTFEVLSKPLPFTVRVNCGDPARHEFGLIELMLGAASTLPAAANTRRNGRIFFIDRS